MNNKKTTKSCHSQIIYVEADRGTYRSAFRVFHEAYSHAINLSREGCGVVKMCRYLERPNGDLVEDKDFHYAFKDGQYIPYNEQER